MLAHLERLAPKQPPEGSPGYWHNRYLDYDGRLGFNAGDHLKSILGWRELSVPRGWRSVGARKPAKSILRRVRRAAGADVLNSGSRRTIILGQNNSIGAVPKSAPYRKNLACASQRNQYVLFLSFDYFYIDMIF